MGDQHSRIDSMFQSKEVTVNGGHTGWLWPNCECKKTHLFMTQLWCGDGSKAIIPICGGVNIHKPVIFGYMVLTHLHVTYNDHQPTGLFWLVCTNSCSFEPCPGKPCRRWNYAFALDGVALGIPSNQKNMTEGFGGWYVKHWPSFSEMVYRKSCRKPRKQNGCEKDGFRLRFPVNQSIESWK